MIVRWTPEHQDDLAEIIETARVMWEWEHIWRHLLLFSAESEASTDTNWKRAFRSSLLQVTKGRADLLWNRQVDIDSLGDGPVFVVCHGHTCYGVLRLASGYLCSSLLPMLPQDLAYLCGRLTALAEHEALIRSQLRCLPPLYNVSLPVTLTSRERDVLLGLARKENENTMAERMGVEVSTIRSHRKRLYQQLGVHTADDAVLRGFALRLIDYLTDIPGSPPSVPSAINASQSNATVHRYGC